MGDSRERLRQLDDGSLNLVMTSPPFVLRRKKEYGNKEQHEYVDWLAEFGQLVFDKLADDGSFVIDIGGAYEKGVRFVLFIRSACRSNSVMKLVSTWRRGSIGTLRRSCLHR